MLETIAFNIRYAFRQFARNRGFALTVVLTISLGIGLNTAMFSVIRAVLLAPLAYQDPDRLVVFANGATPTRFEQILSSARSYDGLGAYAGGMENLAFSGEGLPEALKGARISANFLDVLGVQPLLGRTFVPDEDKPGAPAVVMISASLWQRRFHESPSLIGRPVTLGGTAYTVIGVLPPKFQFPFAAADVWLPRPSESSTISPQSRALSPVLRMFARLKHGVDISQANAELIVIDREYDLAHPGMLDSDKSIALFWHRPPDHVQRLQDQLVSGVRLKLWLLFGAAGLVLMIVCANVASLLLARAVARSHEFAVRAAIGASRRSMIGQLLTESALLSFMGGTLGIALAELSLKAIRGVTAFDLPRSGEIRIDGTVLLFAVFLSLLAGFLFGLAPALSASRTDLAGVLRATGQAVSSARRRIGSVGFNPRSLLVVGQVAISTVLLIAAALLLESLARAYRVDPGFQSANVLTMCVSPSPTRYATEPKLAAFYQALVEQIDSLPGVSSAAITRTLPLTGWAGSPVHVVGRAEVKLNERPLAVIQNITPQYFQTMKIALRRGREFTAHDDAGAAPVVMIDESAARRFWPQYPNGPNPVGQHILVGAKSPPMEIIGIVADVRQAGLTEDPNPGVYFPAAQKPPESAMLAIRLAGEPLAYVNSVRSRISALDPEQPVSEIASMDELVDASEGQLRVMMTLLIVFAAIATLIAVIGLYGIISYFVVQRTKEIGIRKALGAQPGNILALVVAQGLRLALGGLVLGVCGAFVGMRLLRGLLFEVSSTDPATYIEIALLFVVVALAASYFPARRAASIDPLSTLRA
jgi:putative ABC transport system permease protein